MIALDSDGYVYGTAEEGTLLKKYRVHQKREK
jgi:hypothetical protein